MLAARAVLSLATLLVGCAAVDSLPRLRGGDAYTFGAWGDLPYSPVQAASGVPRLLADMNAAGLDFSVHVGDLKSGAGCPCDDALFVQARGFFDSLDHAAMFTPGDNDWADCDRPSNGGYVARERLDRERLAFFATSLSMGRRPVPQEEQQEPPCLGVSGPVPCVENRRWWRGTVVHATLNVAGSCNNLCDTAPDEAEHAARNGANIRWLQETFAAAQARDAAAVVLLSQANPGWDANDPRRAPQRDPRTLRQTDGRPDGFADFLRALRHAVLDFGRPVLYVHGDSHYFRIDKPLLDAAGRRIQTFTRLEVFGNGAASGNNEVHWVRVRVEPGHREVFSFQPTTVPGNREVVPDRAR